MTLPAKDSRKAMPVQYIEVGENPTVCIFCDARTMPDNVDHYAELEHVRAQEVLWPEVCLHCGQRYLVADETDD